MGFIQFSMTAKLEQPLTCDKAAFMSTLNSTQKMDSYTYTGDALQLAAQEYQSHGRKADYRAVILITDGVPCTPATVLQCDTDKNPIPDPTQATKARKWAATLKADGADIISIAVGDLGANGLPFIDDISSAPASKYVFNPSTWEQLPALINSIISSICPPGRA